MYSNLLRSDKDTKAKFDEQGYAYTPATLEVGGPFD